MSSEKLKLKILEFIEYRKEIGKPFQSQKTINALVEKLKNENEKIAIKQIEQSIKKSWVDIYPLKINSEKIYNSRALHEPKPDEKENPNRLNFSV